MTGIRPAQDANAARWLLQADVDWWDLVRYGPPGFEVYVRIAFSRQGVETPVDAVRTALVTLCGYTSTADRGFAAVWEGWGAGPPTPRAPLVPIPHREMLLFAGPVDVLRDAPAMGWYGSAGAVAQEPHLVWPEDHAWCMACEVDEEIEFSVGCSSEASMGLASALPGSVRQVRYGDQVPLYRDEVE